MFTFSQSHPIARPAAEVWSYLVAFEQVPLWEHGVIEVRQRTPGEPLVGTKIAARRIYAGRETHLDGQITEYLPGRSATLLLRGGPLADAWVTYSVEPAESEASSVVTYSVRGRLLWPLRFLHPLLPAIGRAEARKNLRSLERRILAGIPPRSSQRPP